ncbi:MAG TPA: PEP-CTERM sorting domain-containing protein [Thermodesulfovibrionales bacterium]|jgi:hypothetical protein|nr:PEP-CTERM sorting domain-containing protein [Thermodesulfovibrionales bacterium]
MKKIMMLLAVAVLMLGMSGQAMAVSSQYFKEGDVVRVVYFNGTGGTGTGTEYLTDLGPVTSLTSPTMQNILWNYSNFSLSNLGAGATWANSFVGYYSVALGGPNGLQAWVSGGNAAPGGQSNAGDSNFNNIYDGATNVNGAAQVAGGLTHQSVTLAQNNANSYYSKMNINGSGTGVMAGFLNGMGNGKADQNLAALATTGYVDQILYYYGNPDSASDGTPIGVLRTWADGHSELNPTPVPATFLLFGSGLLGLVGIRRKQAV